MLYSIVLILDFVNVNKVITVQRRGIEKETDEINQPRCFKDALTSKWKSKNKFFKWNPKMLWRRGFLLCFVFVYFVFTGNKRHRFFFKVGMDKV